MRSGGLPAGSGRAPRLDPFALPVRFAASDAAADERVRHVELHRKRVVVRRSLAGMRMALNMPVSAFTGVAIRVTTGEDGAAVSVALEHKDPALTLPLLLSTETDEAFADWRAWANVLGLPLLVAEEDGALARAVRAHGRSARRRGAPASAPAQRAQATPPDDPHAP